MAALGNGRQARCTAVLTVMGSLTQQLRLAASVGLVGGFVLGCEEALVAVQVNVFVQAGQYGFLYIAVPILTWMGLAVLLPLPRPALRTQISPAPTSRDCAAVESAQAQWTRTEFTISIAPR
jgi:hypothetical protein